MIYKIAKLLRDEISDLNFVDVAAGLAKSVTVRVPEGEIDEASVIDKQVPMAYNDLGLVCEDGELYPLTPDTTKKSIHWWEDNGTNLVSEDTYYYHSQAALVLVSWWNLPLINVDLTDPSDLVALLIAEIPVKLTNVDYLSQIRVAFNGEVPAGTDVLSKYDFNEPENQFGTHPYYVTGLNFLVDFAFGKNCVDAITINPSSCP
jgi:hypothetical protein